MKLRLCFTAPTKHMEYVEISLTDKQVAEIRDAKKQKLDHVITEMVESLDFEEDS